MCVVCDQKIGRRAFLGLGAAFAATAFAGGVQAAGGATTSVTADEALARLRAGNQKYLSSPQACVADLAAARDSVAKHQAPWATILSCADSRVPPELLFGGSNVGELFIARNAGNMADVATIGTIEYGAAVLGVPLIVVLGHERCGASSERGSRILRGHGPHAARCASVDDAGALGRERIGGAGPRPSGTVTTNLSHGRPLDIGGGGPMFSLWQTWLARFRK